MTLGAVIIGSGPCGHVAAIRAGQIGMKTAIVGRWLPAPQGGGAAPAGRGRRRCAALIASD
jgi:pyruvate/2-oxoglutarate dehydrogenase complex dihydrolipoamide dehydrogenase (E3) component